jgi:hypothetical protein
MAATRDDFTWIELYLADELTEAERSSFQARLAQEPALRQAMREQQEALLAMRLLEKETLRTQLKQNWEQIKAEEEQKMPESLRRRKCPYSFAWLAGGWPSPPALALLFWVFRPAEPLSYPELAMQYFDPDPKALVRGGSEDDSLLLRAEQQYRNAEYAAAELSYDSLLRREPEKIRYAYFYGMSLLAQQKTEAGIDALEPLLSDPLFDEHVRWNLALAYLQVEMQEEALKLLKGISGQERHYKKEEAKALLQRLHRNG